MIIARVSSEGCITSPASFNSMHHLLVPFDEVIKEGMIGSELWSYYFLIFADVFSRIHSHVECHQKAK